ncbi:epidermal retinol dehydrogenase 2 isoform X2 [Hydra vulgaris]|uniref:Epidermal retinol dehydrogenase 2 isoform X2 n=1 Tax=Hydra vulgaris TaxID=6087 RepID=A0ABM4BR54_HYDVU
MALFQDIFEFFCVLLQISILWPWEIIKSFLPKNRKDISNDIMFITGAGSGIGRLMAIKFANCGATIIATDLNGATAQETADIIKSSGGKAYSFQLDVTDRKKVYSIAEKIRETIGEVTMLVNNAGIVTGHNFMECPDDLIAKTIEVNTTSHFWTLKAFLGSMIENNRGHVISIASIAGYGASPQLIDYCASKFGAVGLQEALGLELQGYAKGIKTSTVCPWFIKTGMFEGAKSSMPFLCPMLEPESTADRIVAGVLNDETHIFIPWRLFLLVALKQLIPASVGYVLSDYLQMEAQMTGFVGRKKSI